MNVMAIPIEIGALRTVPKDLERETGETRDYWKNQVQPDHSTKIC